MAMLPEEDLSHVFAHTDWADFKGARLFITGGTGFIGRWLLETLAWSNERAHLSLNIFVLTRDIASFLAKTPSLGRNSAIEFWQGDVRDFEFPEGKFTHVIHAATDTSARSVENDPLSLIQTIVQGTCRVLEFAVRAEVRRFLFISSGAVYGKQPEDVERVPETYLGAPDPTLPSSAYGEGKRIAELLCGCFHRQHGLQTVIARCFAFLGPGLPLDQYAAGNFIRDALRGDPIRVKGDGTAYRSYLYPSDLAIWLWALLSRGTVSRAYNVGSENAILIRDLARQIASCNEPSPNVCLAETRTCGQIPDLYVPSTQRASEELGLIQTIGLADAIRKTMTWHQRRAQ
jgi:nucleoside-diphosphate-sugar epimerase